MNNYFIEPIITFFLPTSVAYPRLKVVYQVQVLEQSGEKDNARICRSCDD